MAIHFRLLLLAAAAAAMGCREKAAVVRIAVAAPLTGDQGAEGRGLARGVDLAIEEANASGRFPFKLELAPFDDRGEPAEAVRVAKEIAADPRIAAVIGHKSSECALPAAKVYAQASVPMISPSATNPEVTAQQLSGGWPGPRNVFRVVPTDDLQGAYAARFAFEKLHKRKMAVVHDNGVYGQGLAERFEKSFLESGGKISLLEGLPKGREYGPLLGRLKAGAPDGIFFGGRSDDAGRLLKQARAAGLRTDFFSGDGAKNSGLFGAAGPAAEGAFLTFVGAPVETLPGGEAFLAAYRRRWNGADDELRSKDHLAYEAAKIMLDALAEAGPGDKARLLEAVRRTRHEGMLGRTGFDEKGDTTNNKIITMTRARCKDRSFQVLGLSEKKG